MRQSLAPFSPKPIRSGAHGADNLGPQLQVAAQYVHQRVLLWKLALEDTGRVAPNIVTFRSSTQLRFEDIIRQGRPVLILLPS
jgi:hypothetical protein